MRFLMIHNDYGAVSGEEIQFYLIARLLRENGHEIKIFTRSSTEIPALALGNLRAFCAGVYNPWSRRSVRKLIESFRPHAVLVKNLFPFISPAVLPVCGKAGVPVIMFVANYRLMCPNGLHMNKGKTCEKCLGGREYNCLLNNCEGSLFKSAGYALRSGVARIAGFYRNNVTAFVCASRFLKGRMSDAGFDPQRMHLIPNVVPQANADVRESEGSYVGYVGRISREKGVHVLLEAAKLCPEVRFRLAGRVADGFTLPDPLPSNVELAGFLQGDSLSAFYEDARLIVSTSECFETFGMSVGEAMQHGKAVVVSRIGVFPEFVQEGVTGLLFETGNANDLSDKIRSMWSDPYRCIEMGRAGREWARREYSPDTYYQRLIRVIESVVGEVPVGSVESAASAAA
jgi:glycosyltransferase involved in cell wall biosynthesis